ncbi:hypothetical protein V6N13_035165 [Hibiscus sabdariffa]
MVDSAGDWIWSLLQYCLPHHILLRLAAVHRPQPSFPMDSMGWGLREDRLFSVKSAYQVAGGILGCSSNKSAVSAGPSAWYGSSSESDQLVPAGCWLG